MFDQLDPRKAGAKNRTDIGAFLIGASIGGIADAVLNVAGFAEPFVFAGLCGAGILGLKQLFSKDGDDNSGK